MIYLSHLIIRSVGGIVSTLNTFQVSNTFHMDLRLFIDYQSIRLSILQVYLIFRFNVRTAVDPTVILGHIGADALKLAAKNIANIQ